eukprot:2595-Pyramimonas_sp.AAC.1
MHPGVLENIRIEVMLDGWSEVAVGMAHMFEDVPRAQELFGKLDSTIVEVVEPLRAPSIVERRVLWNGCRWRCV